MELVEKKKIAIDIKYKGNRLEAGKKGFVNRTEAKLHLDISS